MFGLVIKGQRLVQEVWNTFAGYDSVQGITRMTKKKAINRQF